jgi:hypothetical protein
VEFIMFTFCSFLSNLFVLSKITRVVLLCNRYVVMRTNDTNKAGGTIETLKVRQASRLL